MVLVNIANNALIRLKVEFVCGGGVAGSYMVVVVGGNVKSF